MLECLDRFLLDGRGCGAGEVELGAGAGREHDCFSACGGKCACGLGRLLCSDGESFADREQRVAV
jgi:hypothetical protein